MAAEDPQYFTFSVYRRLLAALRGRDFRWAFFGERGEGLAYLRHDIDLDVPKALEFARLEAEEGAQSTYYVMLNTDAYNPAESVNRRALRDMAAMGHQIGLHVVPEPLDGKAGVESGEDRRRRIEAQIERECRILAELLDVPVRSYSFHRPAPEILSSDFSVDGLENAYNPDFFAPERYISDSNRSWRCGDPVAFVENFAGSRIQALTHPIWWSEAERSTEAILQEFVLAADRRAREYLLANVKSARYILTSPDK